ncbi:MAG TPA: class I SAM-dependent methyltransferase [Motilibacteraceae bacterium]|nr:class I SAM-dependent methyltransferase [Motilibacteraceae bacterium]
MTADTRDYWDAQAGTFDDEPDHGLLDPGVRAAWSALLLPLVPPASRVADLGAGTGSLSVLLAEAGHRVTGLDLAPRMVAAARAKAAAAQVAATFAVGDAGVPPLPEVSVDVVLVRHVLWALPDPDDAVRRWVRLLAPGGRLVLVEGRWWTGGGLPAQRTRELVLSHRAEAEVVPLPDPALWGGPVEDERYLVLSTR